jgi:hypothetical protein
MNMYPIWTFEDLFSTKTRNVNIDFPCYLNGFCAKLSNQSSMTPDIILKYHSTFPLYRAFLSPEEGDNLRQQMKGENAKSIGMFMGTSQSSIQNPRHLRFCKDCYKNDIKVYGEPYWHRSHQIFGVFICPNHKQVLFETNYEVRTTYALRHFYRLEEVDLSESKQILGENKELSYFEVVAGSIVYLLYNFPPRMTLLQLKERYLYFLRQKKLATYNERIKEKEIIKKFRAYYGAEFLDQMNSTVNESNRNNWIKNIFRPKRVHPIRHILFIHFLGLTVPEFFLTEITEYKPFGEGPWICFNSAAKHFNKHVIKDLTIKRKNNGKGVVGTFKCECGFVYSCSEPDSIPYIDKVGKVISYGTIWEQELLRLKKEGKTIKEIACALKVTPLTVIRKVNKQTQSREASKLNCDLEKLGDGLLREERKKKWENLVMLNPALSKTQLRKLAPKEYIWLYRHERKWLENISPKSLKKFSGKKMKGYVSKDKELSKKIYLMAEELKAEEKPIRITKTLIGRKLGFYANCLEKLPLSSKVIATVVETVEEFQIRRIEIVTQKLYADGKHISNSKVKKAASLQQNNLSEKVLRKIDETVMSFKSMI